MTTSTEAVVYLYLLEHTPAARAIQLEAYAPLSFDRAHNIERPSLLRYRIQIDTITRINELPLLGRRQKRLAFA